MFNNVDIEDKIVDHIDGNCTNNIISNLRIVTPSGNCQNRGMDTRNKTGVTGVAKVCSNGFYYYVATWVECSKRKYKYFSIDKLGEQRALQSATEHRKLMIESLNANGEGYTERHGT